MLDLGWLLVNGPCRKIQAGKPIPCSGANITEPAMYILLSGKVNMFNVMPQNDFLPAGSLLPGDVFGGYEFFCNSGKTLFMADIDSIVYVITEKNFDQLAQQQPLIVFELLKAAYTGTAQQEPAALVTDFAAAPAADPADAPILASAAAPAPTVPTVEAVAGSVFPAGHKGYPGIAHPEYGKLVFRKEYTCPFCKKAFKDFKVYQSKLYEAKPMRYDLRRFYTEFATEWYDIITCPHCYFSAFNVYYTDPKPLAAVKIEKDLAAAKQDIKINFSAERDIDYVFTSHYLALLCAPGYVSSHRQLTAKLWGNLSWLYEDVEDGEMANMAALTAAEAYEAVYMESSLTPVQEQVVALTIAGMLHRVGKNENLKKYLFIAKTNKMGNKVYANLADDLMTMLHEEEE